MCKHSINKCYTENVDNKEKRMLLTIGIILFVLWFLGFIAFHITVGFIHILILLAIVLIIIHIIKKLR
jgi:membrane-bound ClpP family serine protease